MVGKLIQAGEPQNRHRPIADRRGAPPRTTYEPRPTVPPVPGTYRRPGAAPPDPSTCRSALSWSESMKDGVTLWQSRLHVFRRAAGGRQQARRDRPATEFRVSSAPSCHTSLWGRLRQDESSAVVSRLACFKPRAERSGIGSCLNGHGLTDFVSGACAAAIAHAIREPRGSSPWHTDVCYGCSFVLSVKRERGGENGCHIWTKNRCAASAISSSVMTTSCLLNRQIDRTISNKSRGSLDRGSLPLS